MEAELGRGNGGRYIKECREREVLRGEVGDAAVAKRLWEFSEKQIKALEKEGAIMRAQAKKGEEEGKEQTSDRNDKRDEGTSGRIQEVVEEDKTESGKEKGKKASRRSRKA